MKLLDDFGQPAIRKQWDAILEEGKLPHAILLYGEPGSGILPGALSLANDILCTSPVKGKACHQCPSCHKAQKCIHPDQSFLLPLAGAKSLTIDFLEQWREAVISNPWMNVYQWTQYSGVEGKQVDIHKEDIQHVNTELCMQAFEGGNKVLIIWMAQFLAKEGNRLLKMIEEPPEQTYFILVTNQREQILPTIRSRCMQCYFPPIEPAEIERLLIAEYKADPITAERIAMQSDRDMNKALALLQNPAFNFNDELAAWFRLLLGRKGHELAAWASKMGGQEKEEQKQFALFALSTVRDILRSQNGMNMQSDEMVKYLQKNFDPEAWHEVINQLQEGYEKIGRNANTKLLWLAISIQVKNQLAMYRYTYINT